VHLYIAFQNRTWCSPISYVAVQQLYQNFLYIGGGFVAEKQQGGCFVYYKKQS
jgi:hypothetical protein